MSDFMLSVKELADLRADVLVTLPDTCTILRASLAAPNAYGHVVPTAGTAASNVTCRLDPFMPGSDRSGLVAGREANRAYFVLSLPWDAEIANGDQVIVGSGDTLDVMQLFDEHSDRAVKRAYVAGRAGA